MGETDFQPLDIDFSHLKSPSIHRKVLEKPNDIITNQGTADRYGGPPLDIDLKAEAKLRWKIDLFVVPTVSLIYLFCFIDRANIGNAKLAGLENDLHLEQYGYNIVLSVFFISFVLFEIPSNIACKWIGPGWYIPSISLGYGICSLCTAFVHDIHSMCAVRFLFGVFEAGMMPGIAYYLSRWYRRSELAFRLSLYIVMAPLAGAFGGLLASGILKLSSFGGLHTWRMLFAIEGIITCAVSLVAFFTLTDRPATAGWLSQDEKDLAIARILSERTIAAEVLDKSDRKKILCGIFSPVTLGTSLIFFFVNITVPGLSFFLPTIVKTIYPHHTVVTQQLFTVPPYIVGGLFTLLFPYVSWKLDRRNVFFIISAPLMMIGYTLFLASGNPHARYGAIFLIASGAFPFGALCNAQVSANVVSDTARSSAIGTTVMVGNAGGLIAIWSFLPFDSPGYHIGYGLNLASSSTILVLSVLLLLWMKRDNSKRDKRNIDDELAGKTLLEQQDLDWKHPNWRWKP